MTRKLAFQYILERLAEEFKAKFTTQKALYLNKQQREMTQISFSSTGRLVDGRGENLNGKYLYAMAPNGRLFAAKVHQVKHHSYFLAGGDVKCAGMITVKDGVLAVLSNESGHYKPSTEDLQQAAKILCYDVQQRPFVCEDHACVVEQGKVSHYSAKYFVMTPVTELVPESSAKRISRSSATGLFEHKSTLYTDAEDIVKQYRNGTQRVSVSHFRSAQNIISHKAVPNASEDYNRIRSFFLHSRSGLFSFPRPNESFSLVIDVKSPNHFAELSEPRDYDTELDMADDYDMPAAAVIGNC